MKRTNCSACGGADLHQFLDLGLSPIADAYTAIADELSERYPLQLAVCTSCWLVQLLEVVDHQTLFGTGYSFYSSASAPLSAYHEAYAADIIWNNTLDRKRHVVEIGSNDGDLARHFINAGYGVIGVDPATGPAYIAAERGVTVAIEPFTNALAIELLEDYGPAELVIANHVLAHVEDVSDVLHGISTLLADDGVAYVEVQYLPDLLLNNAFDLVYHEHRNFFSLASLDRAARRWGLVVANAWLTDRQGGSLRVTLRRENVRYVFSRVEDVRVSELWLTSVSAYDGLQGRAERIRTRLLGLLDDQALQHVVGYGAPAKATTLLNFCGITDQLDFVVDTTFAKQGRFIPGTGIEIKAPSPTSFGDVDTFLILAWNYTREIMRKNTDHTLNGRGWIVPIPVPTLL